MAAYARPKRRRRGGEASILRRRLTTALSPEHADHLDMGGKGELIDRGNAFEPITAGEQDRRVTGKGCRIARDGDDGFEFCQCQFPGLGFGAGTRRIENYCVIACQFVAGERLAKQVEHTSKVRGDGAGYDVMSFEEDGRERFIEVKTTAYAKEAPFFISDGELSFANSHELEFRLYRVFEFPAVIF